MELSRQDKDPPSGQESASGVSKKSHTASGTDSTPTDAEDAADAGPSTHVLPPRKRSLGVSSRPVHITPPRRCMSEVLSAPPMQLLDSPQPLSPHSPHLPGDPSLQPTPPAQVPEADNGDTYTLHLTAIPPSGPSPTHLYTLPRQMTPHPDISPITTQHSHSLRNRLSGTTGPLSKAIILSACVGKHN
ncbi:uncharacterized protein LOC134911364 [Pseudophryne corroboree]|uniref:uncharacterized protein LOC134911364 n=1 Tax=Pseudophryne corroboree TaxID=495146 RepID=UPI003081ED4D